MSNLPEIEFVSTDVTEIEAAVITGYEAVAGYTLAPGDPRRLFLLSLASLIVQQRVVINYTGKQNLLAYAEDDYLDHLGNRVKTPRLKAQAALTTVRYTLSAAQPQAVTIPAGNRSTPGGQIFFATKVATEVPAGTTQVDILAQCTTPGEVGNGWEPGQINRLVDPLPWIASVSNISKSADGTDNEGNNPYRERIRLAPEGFSVAGPDGAYKYWAMTVSSSISDVAVYSPSEGQVVIRPLLQGGVVPGQEILDAVNAICSARDIRPLTDHVSVLAPETVNYDITLTYYIDSEKSAEAATIQAAVTQVVNNYVAWQKAKLGRDINPSELIARVVNAGAKRLSVVAPVFTTVEAYQVAISGTVTVTYGGLENA